MSKKHANMYDNEPWCECPHDERWGKGNDVIGSGSPAKEDLQDVTCEECLRAAHRYGIAAVMRLVELHEQRQAKVS